MSEKPVSKKHIFILLIPNATVFISNFCIMVLELVAGRLIAKDLGVSLYTWTAVIGVVLAGIAVGNYIGGRLADRFPAKKIIARLFIISSLLCIIILVVQNTVANWQFLKFLSFPLHIVLHILIVFFLPSTFMGMISPVVAKMALDMRQKIGYTIGNIYAWGAIGSIVGTFLTGYYFVAVFGTRVIIWFIAGILGLVGVAYGWKNWRLRIWLFILVISIVIGNSSWKWAQSAGISLGFREQQNPLWIYTDESQYTYIKIYRPTRSSRILHFVLDNLLHSHLNIENPLKLEYDYLKIFALITRRLSYWKKNIKTLQIGGGGYVFPRYLEATYPDSLVEVVEIDPAVTKAAMIAFDLPRDTKIKIHHMDGRVFINKLSRQKHNKKNLPAYDFIYTDVFNSYMIPWQITTLEFDKKIHDLLSPDGVYIMNIVEIMEEGRFLGAMLNTMEKVFPYVYVLTEKTETSYTRYHYNRTIVIIGSKKELDLSDLNGISYQKILLYSLSRFEIDKLKKQSKGLILTDDYAPVENLLMKLAKNVNLFITEGRLLEKAKMTYRKGNLEKAMRIYNQILSRNPDCETAHNNLGSILNSMGRFNESVLHFFEVIRIDPDAAMPYNNLGTIYFKKGEIDKAIDNYFKALKLDPNYVETYNNLGIAFYQKGDFKKALYYFSTAVQLNPGFLKARQNLKIVRNML